MAAALFSSSSQTLAIDSFPPLLPSRPPLPSPSDPPPSNANPSSAIPGVSSGNMESHGADLRIPQSSSNFTKCDFASLFNSLPRNAGVYEPQHFEIPRDAPPKSLPDLVKQTGMDFWSSYLVGFFLDGTLNYLAVTNFLKRYWKLQGTVDIKFDGRFYYFKFSNDFEKDKILTADPIFIRGRMFILTKWDPMIGNAQSQIRKVPVWIHFYRIPTILWTLVGINWLVCHIGKLICFDSSTERMNRFRYAKALVEVSPDYELPDSIPIAALGDNCPSVKLSYDWKPMICTVCKEFGHDTFSCELNNNSEANGDRVETREGNQQKEVNVHNRQNKQSIQEDANLNNWKTVNTKKKKYWRMKTNANKRDAVNEAAEIGKVSSNPFANLDTANCDHDRDDNEVQTMVHTGNADQNNGESLVDTVVQGNDVQRIDEAGLNCSEAADGNILGDQGTHAGLDPSSSASTPTSYSYLAAAMSSATTYSQSASVTSSTNATANGKPGMCSTFASCSSMNATGNLANSSIPSTFATTSCTSTPLASTPSKSSPYGGLKPPSNIQLPPPNVTGSGLTFPVVNSAMLSSAVPTSSLPSSKSKNKKPHGKFWVDDDLNEGNDYMPEDVMPFSNKLKASRRQTRKNPLYDDFIT